MKKILIIIILILLPAGLRAATISVSAKAGTEIVNAVEGTLVLPPDTSVSRILTGDSVILIWITTPTLTEKDHTISFAGLVPGGFSGTKPLFTLELASGTGGFAGGKLFGYRNDGKGTQIVLKYEFSSADAKEDREWPEPFAPEISRSPDLFGGRHFISFVAQDKGTGIEHYEIMSTWILPPWFGSWERVSSPHELSSLELFKVLHVRAYDKEGFYREESVSSPYHYVLLGIGIIIITCLLFFARRFSH